jgi:ankyrin repeat protein
MIRLLLDHGADMNARDVIGRTALQIARERKAAEVVALLSEAGATE